MKFEKDSGPIYQPSNESYLSSKHFSRTHNIYTISNSDLIFTHSKGATYYHRNGSSVKDFNLDARIRKVKLIVSDSILFGGTYPFNSSIFTNTQPKNNSVQIKYVNNSLRFNFGTSVPRVNEEIKYKYQLKGFDTKWSSWTKETMKDYTNLSAGTYTFMVKAQSPTQKTGEIATYKFMILPPRYLTSKAFLLYFILLLINTLIIYWIIRNRVRKKFKKVEKDIKIDLFTNISHEIKTPITLILSPLEEIIAKAKETDENNSLHLLMYRNAKKLKHLVNLLLDLRKVETGSMHLQVKKEDIIQFVEDIFIPFNYIACQNRIDYRLNTVFDSREMYFDPQKLEIILTNILSNAFKYTNKEGKISVTLCENTNNLNAFILKDFKESPPSLKIGKFIGRSSIKIVIEDTGAGISEEEISKIFKRFYHDTKKNHLNSKNTGIGLAFTEKVSGDFIQYPRPTSSFFEHLSRHMQRHFLISSSFPLFREYGQHAERGFESACYLFAARTLFWSCLVNGATFAKCTVQPMFTLQRPSIYPPMYPSI